MSLTKLCTIAVSLLATFSPVVAKEVEVKASTKKAKTTLSKASSKLKTTKASSKKAVETKAASTATKVKSVAKDSKTKAKAQSAKASSGISAPNKKTLDAMNASAKGLSATQNKTMLKTLNSGSPAELVALPGIGEKTAVSIKGARPFKSVTDLGNIKGIGAKKFSGVVTHFKK